MLNNSAGSEPGSTPSSSQSSGAGRAGAANGKTNSSTSAGAASTGNSVVVRCTACNRLNRVNLARIADKPKCSRCSNPLPFDRPLAVTDGDFQTFIDDAKVPVVVDFYADWCGPCKMMAPVLDAFARQRSGEVLVLKLDTDANPITSQRFRIASIPTLLVFREGREWKRQVGAVSKGALEAMLIE